MKEELRWMPYEEWMVRKEWERELYARWGLPYIEVYRKGDSSEEVVAEYRSLPTSESAEEIKDESI